MRITSQNGHVEYVITSTDLERFALEEVALTYGYSLDQLVTSWERDQHGQPTLVINFKRKKNDE
jgi:hypothetical protein